MNNEHISRYRTAYTLNELRALKSDLCILCGDYFILRLMICGLCEECWVSSFVR